MLTDTELANYKDALDNHLGFCLTCREWTRDCTEPDADGYDCPQCDGHQVIGADNYLMDFA